MSIDAKIAELLEEAKLLQGTESGKKDVTKGASAPEGTNLPAASAKENEETKLANSVNTYKEETELDEADYISQKIGAIRSRDSSKSDAEDKQWGKARVKDLVKKNISSMKTSKKPNLPEEAELTLEDFSVEELEEFMMSEDFEQLDELSKETLKSYANKAKVDYAANRMKLTQSGDEKAEKRRAGVKTATAKLAKEEYSVDISEDVAALTNGEDLSEEFKTKAAVIFEAAVVNRVKEEVSRLEEEFDKRLEEEVESIAEGLIEKVDGYLNYMVEQWMNDNALALEHGMKNEIMESFIQGMKGLFEQHYIDVPEEKYDVIGDLQEQLDTMSSKLDEQLETNVALYKELNEMHRASAVNAFTVDMVATDADKFNALAEELVFEDVASFNEKLQIIKENYFGKKPVTTIVESVVTDSPVEEQLTEEVKQEQVDPTMARYLRAFGGNK